MGNPLPVIESLERAERAAERASSALTAGWRAPFLCKSHKNAALAEIGLAEEMLDKARAALGKEGT